MNKSELCARLADETGLTLDEAIKTETIPQTMLTFQLTGTPS